jgi:hypothetical protein
MTQLIEEEEPPPQMTANGMPVADEPMPEIGVYDDDDMTTNPSIIHGPIGGVPHNGRENWPYEPTPPHSNGNLLAGQTAPGDHRGLTGTEAGLLGAAVGAAATAAVAAAGRSKDNVHDQDQDQYDDLEQTRSLPEDALDKQTYVDDYDENVNHDFGPMPNEYPASEGSYIPAPLKDEGYISANNMRSPGGITPEPRRKGLQLFGDDGMAGIDDVMGDDPFYSGKGHSRQLSGNSHGMPSPLYDSSTGRGIDRIQSKDIVALMDHLTVRDAQRNARDTEILVTLVRSAAEMRNSFEDMKKLLAETEGNIIDTTGKNTERSVQKVINGPRPQPTSLPRTPRRTSQDDDHVDDLPKRKNVFKRALKGLSMRNSNDLSKIEEM